MALDPTSQVPESRANTHTVEKRPENDKIKLPDVKKGYQCGGETLVSMVKHSVSDSILTGEGNKQIYYRLAMT
jgi:hypothetical protein